MLNTDIDKAAHDWSQACDSLFMTELRRFIAFSSDKDPGAIYALLLVDEILLEWTLEL